MPDAAPSVPMMIDTIHFAVPSIPADAPKVAGYLTGDESVRWTAEDWARFSGVKVGINQMRGKDPLLGDVLDVEPGAWDNIGAAQACLARQRQGLEINLYTSEHNLTPLLDTCIAIGVTSGNLWVANLSLSVEEATAMVVHRYGPWPIQAVQWADEGNCLVSVTAPEWPAGSRSAP